MTERVLAIKLGALGDILLADGALHDLRLHHPDAELHVLTRRGFAPLLRRCPWIDHVAVDENAPRWRLPALIRWRRWFRAGDYRRVYDLQNSDRTLFYRRWLAADFPRGHWSASGRPDAAARRLSVPERHARQLEAAGVPTMHSRRPTPLWMADDASALLHALDLRDDASRFVLLLPGSSARHAHKRWPGFMSLSHALVAQGLRVITVPGPEEADLGPGYAGDVLRDAGRALDLHQLAGLARHAACVVGNDSGPLHLTACLDAPCVALFDAGNPSLDATGIETRHATRLIGTPLRALTVEAVVAAVLQRMETPLPAHAATPADDDRR